MKQNAEKNPVLEYLERMTKVVERLELPPDVVIEAALKTVCLELESNRELISLPRGIGFGLPELAAGAEIKFRIYAPPASFTAGGRFAFDRAVGRG